jgi:hypothetical protein
MLVSVVLVADVSVAVVAVVSVEELAYVELVSVVDVVSVSCFLQATLTIRRVVQRSGKT